MRLNIDCVVQNDWVKNILIPRLIPRFLVFAAQAPLPALAAAAGMMAVGLSPHTAEAFTLAPTSFVPRAGGHPSVASGTELYIRSLVVLDTFLFSVSVTLVPCNFMLNLRFARIIFFAWMNDGGESCFWLFAKCNG